MKSKVEEVRAVFERDVANHKLSIVYDDRPNRNIVLAAPGTGVDGFALTTWPGHLAISGDRGCYVFRRTRDMFEFFRQSRESPISINPGYWGEKLEAIDRRCGYRAFSRDLFIETVKDYFDLARPDFATDAIADDAWEDVKESVINAAEDGEHAAYAAVTDYRYGDFYFEDFFDDGVTEEFTSGYLWALHAIVWGIRKYDEAKTA